MTSNPPPALPQGMTDLDFEAIEAAVTETVRGRWFLAEFARRNRGAEVTLMLDAMGRLETLVTAQAPRQAALPPPPSADPSIRLLVQRIKEIAAGLDATAREMRDAGLAARYWAPVEQQARAVAGLMRTGGVPASRPESEKTGGAGGETTARAAEAPPLMSRSDVDPRLHAFSGLDHLPLREKLAFFT